MEIETKLEKKGGKSIRQRHEATNKQTVKNQRNTEKERASLKMHNKL